MAIAFLFLPNFQVDGASLIGTEVKYSIYVSCCLIAIVLSKTRSSAPKIFFFPFCLICLFGFASVFWSNNQDISLSRGLFNIVMVTILFFLSKKTDHSKMMRLVLDAGFFTCIITLAGTLPAYIFESPQSYFLGNFRGYFSNSNVLGHLIGMLAIPYSLTLSIYKNKWRYIYVIMLLLLCFILFLSRSRAGLLAAVVAASYIYYSQRHRLTNAKQNIVLLLASAALVFVIQKPGFLLTKYERFGVSSPLATRSYLWDAHLNAINERPFFGWGLGINPVYFKGDLSTSERETEKGNSFVILPEELGIPLSSLILIAFIPMIVFFKKSIFYQNNPNTPLHLTLSISIILAGIVHSFFESWLFSFGNPMSLIFWVSCICSFKCLRSKQMLGQNYFRIKYKLR